MPSQAGLAAPDQGEVALYLLQLVGRGSFGGKRVAGWRPAKRAGFSFAAARGGIAWWRRHC